MDERFTVSMSHQQNEPNCNSWDFQIYNLALGNCSNFQSLLKILMLKQLKIKLIPIKCTEFKLKLVSLKTSLSTFLYIYCFIVISIYHFNIIFYGHLSFILLFSNFFSSQFSSLEVYMTKKPLIIYKEENGKQYTQITIRNIKVNFFF